MKLFADDPDGFIDERPITADDFKRALASLSTAPIPRFEPRPVYVSHAELRAMARMLEERNVPPFVCRDCGKRFYRIVGLTMVGKGWRPGYEHEDPDLCGGCDFGEAFRGLRVNLTADPPAQTPPSESE